VVDDAYRLSINLPALEFALSLSIQRVSHFVAAALSGHVSSLTEPLYGQGSVVAYQYSPPIAWSVEEAASEFRTWILLSGFRDLAETITHFLGSVQSISTTALLQELQAEAGHITPAQWQELVVNRESRFEKANLPDKLRLLVEQCRLEIPSDVKTHVQSLYSVRNCLVHRSGVVQETDVGGESTLRATWLCLRPYIVTADGEEPLVIPHLVKSPGHVAVRREVSSKDFAIGERIVFSSEEFHDIAHGAFLSGAMTIQALERRLRAAGIPMSDAVPPSA
jgi:hypothetical protein